MIQPIPDGLICLTFDDGVKSQHRFVVLFEVIHVETQPFRHFIV